MKNNVYILADKYASAFLNLYIQKIDLDEFYKIKKVIEVLVKKQDCFYFLKIPAINKNIKSEVISNFFQNAGLLKEFDNLVKLLIDHGRIEILKEVLEKICEYYKKRKNIEEFWIICSNNLKDTDLKIISCFLKKNLNKDIIYNYKLDTNLIAGLCLKSNHYLWEYSIQKKIKELSKSLIS